MCLPIKRFSKWKQSTFLQKDLLKRHLRHLGSLPANPHRGMFSGADELFGQAIIVPEVCEKLWLYLSHCNTTCTDSHYWKLFPTKTISGGRI